VTRKAVIIGNPNSGSAGDEGYLERFAQTLRAGGLVVEILNTERPDHATELAAATDPSHTEACNASKKVKGGSPDEVSEPGTQSEE
jgi:diacylglycerol kinase family enzyme